MPKVSIILPNYNHEKFINERMDSILKQTFTDFELIILDDASTDNSLQVIESYDDPRIKSIIKNKRNSGSTFIQWQRGLHEVEGEYIWIAESDDSCEPNFLETLVKALDSNPNLALAFSSSDWIDNLGQLVHSPPHETDKTWQVGEIFSNDFLKGNTIYNASSAVFRKSCVSKEIDFQELSNYRYVGDWYFWVQLLNGYEAKRINLRLNHFRRHKNNVSTKADSEGLQFSEGLKVLYYIFKNHSVPLLKRLRSKISWSRKIAQSGLKFNKEISDQIPLEIKILSKLIVF